MSREEAAAAEASSKAFLGLEFLTWLWWRSETGGGRIAVSGEEIGVSFERFILLQDSGQDHPSALISRGRDSDLADAKGGLLQGKKVAKAHLRVGRGEDEWRFTLTGLSFDFSSFRLPRTVPEEEGELDHAARVLERMALLERGVEAVDMLYRHFLSLRLDDRRWVEEKRGLRQWISGG